MTLAFTPLAWAQPAAAQKHIVEGDRAAQQNKWPEALASFQKAHEANPSAATATRIANALYKLDRKIEAFDAYEALVKERGATLLGADKKTANDRLAELGGKLGSIAVRVSETGASVAVDGAAVGTSPLAKPVRVTAGTHKLAITKDGFSPFESTIEVAGKATVTVDAQLKESGASLSVTVKGGEGLQVMIDGAEVGPAPWQGVLPPGPHKVAARSPKASAPEVLVELKNGVATSIELVAGGGVGSLEVRVEVGKAQISVDGRKVGEGNYKGELSEGEHDLSVTAEGFAPFEKKVTIVAGEIQVETVSLRKATAGEVLEPIERAWRFDGLYGGFQLIGMFEPGGQGNTLESSCEVTGATSCESSMPMGGAVAGYIGYAFAPIGLELLLLGAGDISEPSATFDGTSGSDVNPLVASPAREESFLIGRFGGGGALRLRLLIPVERFCFTGAVGAGLAYREMLLGRETVAENGATSSIGTELGTDSEGYITGVLSIELGAQVLLAGTTSLTIGANLWLEHAGDGVPTPAESDVLLTGEDGQIPAPQATPSYDMASGTQVFVGPFIGMHFGP